MAKFDDDFVELSEERKHGKQMSAFSLAVQIILYILLIFFAVFFIWYTTFISTHKYYTVVGASMKNTLNNSLALDDQYGSEDAVYVNTTSKVQAFDIVVATRQVYNAEKRKYEKKDVVKRVMALEGDYVSVAFRDDGNEGGSLFFYRIPKGTDLNAFDDEQARLDESVGENGYKIYSYDEWTEAKDLASFSVIDEKMEVAGFDDVEYELNFFETFLEGKLSEISKLSGKKFDGSEDFFVSNAGLVYVKVPKGAFFCMGDNRGHSSDSRDNGFYQMSQIVGKAEIIIYNYNFGKRLLKVVDYYFAQVEKFFAR